MQTNNIDLLYIKSYKKNKVVLSSNEVIDFNFALYDNCHIGFSTLDVLKLETYMFLNSISKNKEIFIVGCGNKFIIPSAQIKNFILSKGLALEWMTTSNAYHTFNLLIEDGRSIIGLFINEN